MNNTTIGWDVGGAHLKAALLDSRGKLQQVLQVPCALWRGLHELEAAIDLVLQTFNKASACHAVTMTGELVDLFATRKDGVQSISRTMAAKLKGTILFYTGTLHPVFSAKADFSGFVSIDDVDSYWQQIASANWIASASYVATKISYGLLVDVGSTTSDFVLLANNKPVCVGFTDAVRMQLEELVYTGVVRTPLMAFGQKIEFANVTTSVAAEFFATSADVYRLTGDLQADDDMADTADGQDKTQWASARRIARMIGRDVDDAPMVEWMELAYKFKMQQMTRLKLVALAHIACLTDKGLSQSMCLIGAGVGSFLVREIAKSIGIQYIEVADLIAQNAGDNTENRLDHDFATKRWASVCLPAYALAQLAYHQL